VSSSLLLGREGYVEPINYGIVKKDDILSQRLRLPARRRALLVQLGC
jgi:hypothetical protein